MRPYVKLHRPLVGTHLRQYVQDVMYPAGQRRFDEIAHGQRLELRVVLHETAQLGLLVVFLVEQVEPGRRDVRAGADARYLRSQVVGLVARERRVTDDLPESATKTKL